MRFLEHGFRRVKLSKKEPAVLPQLRRVRTGGRKKNDSFQPLSGGSMTIVEYLLVCLFSQTNNPRSKSKNKQAEAKRRARAQPTAQISLGRLMVETPLHSMWPRQALPPLARCSRAIGRFELRAEVYRASSRLKSGCWYLPRRSIATCRSAARSRCVDAAFVCAWRPPFKLGLRWMCWLVIYFILGRVLLIFARACKNIITNPFTADPWLLF